MFEPIVPPPTEHHGFAAGHSTEFGDSAKVAVGKINAGFKHIYSVLQGLGASLADEVEYVAKSDFDDVVHELGEVKAELNNLKMMVQGLGFAGTRTVTAPTAMEPAVTVTVTAIDPAKADEGTTIDPQASAEPVMVIGKLEQ